MQGKAFRPSRILGVAALSLAAALAPNASAAEWYKVSRIEYVNRGDYAAKATVTWRDEGGDETDGKGASVPRRASHAFDAAELVASQHALDVGEELWLEVLIDGRTETSCRDRQRRFRFDPDGGVLTYQTGGSVLRGHACKIKRGPGEEHLVRD